MKTIHEIRAEHSAKAGAILTGYQDEIGEIRSTKTLPEGAYLDRLTDEQRFGLLREQKAQRAADAHAATLREYEREVERYQADLSERTDALKGRLFGVSDAGALPGRPWPTRGSFRRFWRWRLRPQTRTSPAPSSSRRTARGRAT